MITIERTEREIITGRGVPIDKQEFSSPAEARACLVRCVPELTAAQVAEVLEYAETNFERQEMILRVGGAFLGRVVYQITVPGGAA